MPGKVAAVCSFLHHNQGKKIHDSSEERGRMIRTASIVAFKEERSSSIIIHWIAVVVRVNELILATRG